MKDREEIRVGYGRVSTTDKQDSSLENQRELLEEFGCNYIFFEKSSGRNDNRKEFKKCISKCKELAYDNDVVLVVVKSDRLSRKFTTLVNVVNELDNDGIKFKSLTEGFDTSKIEGKLMFNILSSFAEYEVNQTRERIKLGLEKARKDGKTLGIRRDLELEEKVVDMYKNRSNTIEFIAKSNNIATKTVYNIATRNGLSRKVD
ncbi:recombinase family protein [Vagococcus carniphilus]|uniref:recombinase family protein n=1 Tax=Vagococcus carniphilus TaxID=218144 RepID=UPI00288EB0F5|nr:recombinase family protein [Vagococcus carniphilus]MDT2830282.1 recombinase family protein [Vagococcus carniphilus]MDT2838714.1 recombinase family protein [Vagococcus carniphilus]MDT2853552.1 recombinase family protein [Vagococcus carniphilus]